MRLIFLLLAMFAVVAGIVFGALNGHEVALDLYFGTLALPLGVALLCFAFIGAATAGLLLWLGVIFPQRRRLSALRRRLAGVERSGVAAVNEEPAAVVEPRLPVAGILPPP